MPSASDKMLSGGLVPLIQSVHGESIVVMSGTDQGKTFPCVREVEQDIVLDAQLGEDRRSKHVVRFMYAIPNLESQDIVKTDDGSLWHCVRNPQDGYLSTDFELKEIVNGKDS